MIDGNNFLFPDPDYDDAQSPKWKIILLYVPLYYFLKRKDYLLFLCF